MPLFVQAAESLLDIRINPSVQPIGLRFGARGNDPRKSGVSGDNKTVLPNSFGKRLRHSKAIQRHDRPQFRFNPKSFGVITGVRHREYAIGVGLKQQIQIDGQMMSFRVRPI
jgi:hypothetical protein